MYLTISTTTTPATDLGFLLHKHPGRAQSFELPVGTAHVFYPEATELRCTAALLLEVDPIALVRGKRFGGGDAFSLGQYVNDRPYAASSMLAVALGRVFRTAMTGRCDARPELAGRPLPLEIHVPALPSSGGADLVRALFEPLGWSVDVHTDLLDPQVPTWGESRYVDVRLSGTVSLDQALSHLYVLLPVLDNAKHYWVGTDEVEKLIRTSGAWLPTHPEKELITRRYLAHQKNLVLTAVGRLAEIDDSSQEAMDNAVTDEPIEETPRQISLVSQRKSAVLAELRSAGAARVVDLGCGEGALLRELLQDASFSEVVGVDVSHRALDLAEKRLHLERMPDSQRARLRLQQSSLTYRDERFAAFDAVVLMEVIEHLDLPRLPSVERTVFAHARPRTVIVTTPNAEHNVRFESLPAGTMRHPDHRFEWTRAEFAAWAETVASSRGYTVRYAPIGPDDPQVGPPTQMAIFTRVESAREVS